MDENKDKLCFKKLTLQAWAKIALKDGLISNETYKRMSQNIDRIKV